MSRSNWKVPFNKIEVLFKINKSFTDTKIHKTFRNVVILPKFTGKKFKVHNGKTFYNITVNENMIGHRFGEFILTRKAFEFKKK